ncbi:MAG: GNAT family N-acetyltransferase [Caulobacter sp.]|nr:GNAT family N-acetyltransferase [Caulobacter sp.]
MTIEIVRLTTANAGLLRNVAEDVFDTDVVPSRLRAYLAEPVNLMIVAVDGDLVVGQAAAVIHKHPDKPDELYIDEVGVSPDWRRRGIAQRMMEALFALGGSMGCQASWLATEVDNLPARRLYESFGENGVEIVMFDFDL